MHIFVYIIIYHNIVFLIFVCLILLNFKYYYTFPLHIRKVDTIQLSISYVGHYVQLHVYRMYWCSVVIVSNTISTNPHELLGAKIKSHSGVANVDSSMPSFSPNLTPSMATSLFIQKRNRDFHQPLWRIFLYTHALQSRYVCPRRYSRCTKNRVLSTVPTWSICIVISLTISCHLVTMLLIGHHYHSNIHNWNNTYQYIILFIQSVCELLFEHMSWSLQIRGLRRIS